MKILFITRDYADEFDYPIYSLMSDELYADVMEYLETKQDSHEVEEWTFGSNEFISLSRAEIYRIMLKEAKDISEHELQVLNKFVPSYVGLDIIEQLVESAEEFEPG